MEGTKSIDICCENVDAALHGKIPAGMTGKSSQKKH